MIECPPAQDTVGMHVSGLRGSLEPTTDRKRQLHRKFVDYYSRSFGFARIKTVASILGAHALCILSVEMTRRGYRLRLIRFSTFFGAVLFADFAITVSLWLSGTGGPSKESQTNNEDRLEFSIVAFTFKKSVFDLFLFSLLRLLVCGFLLWKVENLMINELLINSEDYVINQLSDERLYSRRKQSLLVLIVILMLANTGYVVAKGGVILSDGSEHSFGRSSGPPLTYGICLITSSLFALIEVGLATVAFRHLNIGAFQKCVLGFSVNTNDKDAKYNGKDKEEKKQVPVSRVIGLAKPVRALTG